MDEQGKAKGKKASTCTLWIYFLGGALGSFVLLVSLHRTVAVMLRHMDASSTTSAISPSVVDTKPVVTTPILSQPSRTVPNSVNPSVDLIPAAKLLEKPPTSVDVMKYNVFPPLSPTNSAKFSDIKTQVATTVTAGMKKKISPSILEQSIRCPAEMISRYDQLPDGQQGAVNDLEWCNRMKTQHRVNIGKSWGSLGRDQKLEWDRKKCNELVSLGKLQTCAERWGWKWFENWSKKKYEAFYGGSNVTCISDVKTATYCQMEQVVMDFGKMQSTPPSRSFESGFISLYGTKGGDYGKVPPYPGIRHLGNRMVPSVDNGQCDVLETRPTFILSNDDIYNLGHYMNDVLGIWNMFTLANRAPGESLLINIDGVRVGGPAGGPAHRLMEARNPDHHGPYSDLYYHKWFNEVKKGVDYGHQKVCFKELYVFPLPGVPWFWNNWGIVDECSTHSQSPLYQSFNVFLRQSLIDHFGEAILLSPPTDHVHIVIEVRKIDPRKGNNHATSRYIANLRDLIAALSAIPNVKVTAQNFAELNFMQQIQLAHSASIFLSMHGAGTTHIFHAALGQRNCCGFVEMFPDATIDLHNAFGYGNLGRMLGFHHYRYVATRGSTGAGGTVVEVQKVKAMVLDAIDKITAKPTCLLDVKDTRFPISTGSSGF